jgi:hypothetical protein
MSIAARFFALLLVLAPAMAGAQNGWTADPLEYRFTGRYGQVEVGGPFAGAEFHESRPLPSRISFFSPVANSIDLSTDYWKRADSHPFRAGVRIDADSLRWLGGDSWDYVLSPHRVAFHGEEGKISCTMTYDFGLQEPVMAFRWTLVNASDERMLIGLVIDLQAVLRSCQTYARFDDPAVSYDSAAGTIIARFSEPQTAGASVFLQNGGGELLRPVLPGEKDGSAHGIGFTQERYLDGRDSMTISILIGTCRNEEATSTVRRVKRTWTADIAAYDHAVRIAAEGGAVLTTGDPWVDRTIPWANALLAANAHFLEGTIVPMPCPAEYNFFFTHDMLLTDLAATAFDAGRVRRDLSYIAGLAKDLVIPHARYWKDDGFKTEYCTPDNWNHLWFILVAGSYLRHAGDTLLGQRLYPLLQTSMRNALLRLKGDHLMYAQAPDWWDIGKNEGPRAYMTVLVIRALREYTYIGTLLGMSSSDFGRYEAIADEMTAALRERLWDDPSHYLINYNGPVKDTHVYMGSLLAPVFGLLDPLRAEGLVQTAGERLLADGIGIRTVMPPDFHTDPMRAFFHFVGNEAGDPYLYANGGVWPHNNAWYALALGATGRLDDAFLFYRTTMTLDGIARSPRGQPAFYEYRYSDPASPRYGEIDKPSFLWAAGFTLLTGYRLLGLQENEWNISFLGELPSAVDTGRCALEFGGRKEISISGKGKGLRSFTADGRDVPSLVLPLDIRNTRVWALSLGASVAPYLARINAQLHRAAYDAGKRTMRLTVSSFSGHAVTAKIELTDPVQSVRVDGKRIKSFRIDNDSSGRRALYLEFAGAATLQDVVITFQRKR